MLAPFGLAVHPLSLNTVGERGTSTNPLDDTLPHPVAPPGSHQPEGRSHKLPVRMNLQLSMQALSERGIISLKEDDHTA